MSDNTATLVKPEAARQFVPASENPFFTMSLDQVQRLTDRLNIPASRDPFLSERPRPDRAFPA